MSVAIIFSSNRNYTNPQNRETKLSLRSIVLFLDLGPFTELGRIQSDLLILEYRGIYLYIEHEHTYTPISVNCR